MQASACNFIKTEALAQVFSWELCELFRSTFSYKTPPVAAFYNGLNFRKSNPFSFQMNISGISANFFSVSKCGCSEIYLVIPLVISICVVVWNSKKKTILSKLRCLIYIKTSNGFNIFNLMSILHSQFP